ncbi:MAG: hypothetical protein O6952_04685, partial [Planctomycetota bacterium]|nr:hypothetical protein [Planctomycetota bacterium]
MALSRSACRIAVLLLLAPACVSPYTTSRKMMSDATRLLSMGEELDALEQARAAVAWVPFDIEVHWLYQDLLLASGRRNEAIDEYFLRARSAHGNRAMSILLERLGGPRTKKLEMLKRHLAEAREDPWARLALAEASLEMGDPSGAEKWLHEAGGVPEGRAEVPIHLVSALRAGRFDEARSLARRIVSDEDLRPPPSAPLVYAHLLEGNLLEALRVGRRIHPGEDRPEAFRALGIALLRSRSYVASLIAFG